MQAKQFIFGLLVTGSTVPAFATYTVASLATLDSATGYHPETNLLLSGNTLYGMTTEGGANGDGTIFSMPVTGGTPTVLTSFDSSDMPAPQASLSISGNTLYETTAAGGTNSAGGVFSEPIAGGTPTMLSSFDGTDIADPQTGVSIVGDTIYGVAETGGSYGFGEVFSIPITGGTPTAVASFNNTDGYRPNNFVISGNTIYGATALGGKSHGGVIYSVPLSGGTPTVLDQLVGLPVNPGLLAVGSSLVGTYASDNSGQAFSTPTTGGKFTTLTTLSAAPTYDVAISGSTIYGTTTSGQIYSANLAGGGSTILTTFSQSDIGLAPIGGVTLDAAGNIYGTTAWGPNVASNDSVNTSTVYEASILPNIQLSNYTQPSNPINFVPTLQIIGGNSTYGATFGTFSPTTTGGFPVAGWNPTTDTELYALLVSDSVAANLPADLSTLVAQINAGTYSGYSVFASTTDPSGGLLTNIGPGGFNLFVTITDPTLGSSENFLGFDLTLFNGSPDQLTATAMAVVPEPTSLSLLALGSVGLLARRRRRIRVMQS